MYWKINTAPSSEPVSVDDVKTHLRISSSDDDTYIQNILIPTARSMVENMSQRAILTQTWDLYLDEFPGSSEEPIYVPRPPLQSVSYIKYIDTNGDEQTWSSDEYQVDTNNEPARIYPAYGYTWPSARDEAGAVRIQFVAGYADDTDDSDFDKIPKELLHAIYLLVGHWYENREATLVGSISKEIEFSVMSLINAVKVNWSW